MIFINFVYHDLYSKVRGNDDTLKDNEITFGEIEKLSNIYYPIYASDGTNTFNPLTNNGTINHCIKIFKIGDNWYLAVGKNTKETLGDLKVDYNIIPFIDLFKQLKINADDIKTAIGDNKIATFSAIEKSLLS